MNEGHKFISLGYLVLPSLNKAFTYLLTKHIFEFVCDCMRNVLKNKNSERSHNRKSGILYHRILHRSPSPLLFA